MRANRRGLMAAGLTMGVAPVARAVSRGATMLVPGPADGAAVRWASALAGILAAQAAPPLATRVVGGADGVTAANRFAAEAGPDGQMLLVLNGAAAQARLIGETRARFDPAGWLPVCAGIGAATVIGTGTLQARQRPIRVALRAPDAPEAVALLVFDLLGLPAIPVLGAGAGALESDAADVAIATVAWSPRWQPWFALGATADAPAGDVPHALDLVAAAPEALRGAVRAAGLAVQLEAALVLPALTEADRLARWRAAAQRWVEEGPPGRRLDGPAAAALLTAASPPPEAMLAYREWLLRRLGVQPG